MAHTSGPSTDRIGVLMLAVGFALGLALLYVVVDGWLESQRNPNRPIDTMVAADGVREVHLERNRYSQYVAEGTINNVDVVFLVDTGATAVAIPESIAMEAGLGRGRPLDTQTAAGTVTTYSTVIDELTMGHIEMRNVRANINPHMQDTYVLLGMSALGRLDLNQTGRTLTIRQVP